MKNQLFPLFLTVITFLGLTVVLLFFVHLLNLLPTKGKILLQLRPIDVFVGLSIYLKTAIDFALFIGYLMHRHGGIKNRIAIELGTSLGNGIGTILILTLWVFLKEIPIILVVMIFLASLVLLRMAEDGLDEYQISNIQYPMFNSFAHMLRRILIAFNKPFDPILGKLLPRYEESKNPHSTFFSLFLFALTIPFLLGLDDFAGYIPLFSIINVVGFAIGALLGHMLLTASLFTFPQKTIQIVRQPVVLFVGSVLFLGLAVWGLGEVVVSLYSFIFV